MGPLEIAGTARLALGLVTGIAFGFILQKGQALKFHKIIDALRLRDFTIWKLMFTAIAVGMIGIYVMTALGLAKLHIKPTILSANILGGLIFGAGFALLGFCPGTCVGAAGEGRLDGLYSGVAGLLVGAGLYSEVYPYLLPGFLKIGVLGKITLPQFLGIGVWPTVLLVALALGTAIWFLDRIDRGTPAKAESSKLAPSPIQA
ncbi:MAG TPA: YeeE/YedE thiosulfate transporter family protein [Dehalococcoidia bacterium]|nr:YeeE/YedE thiosulfate transporter family protein [Dehalococcoidia bacterium]